jgi:2-(1,2-epoxy-1,2-dihydrophenyl)acetyl-CoA isomerase
MAEVLSENVGEGVLLITLNRPERMNTLGGTIVNEFAAAMLEATNDPGVRAIAITGAGRAFCAGAELGGGPTIPILDFTSPAKRDHLEALNNIDEIQRNWSGAAWACPKPTVALVNGAAAGAGLALALTLDFRIAAESSIYVSAFARVGLSGDNGVTYALAHLVGRSKALEILMLSPRIGAAEALELGLVREVVPDAELRDRGLEFTARLAAGPTTAFAIMKRNLAFAETSTYEQALEREGSGIAVARASGDFKAAAQAFVEKRPPKFN